ncbi:dehydrogenase [Halopseudomonas nanhaiensis]|uniref:PA2817 family protein n=1 Tax=Halopseudomonas nanhaiensis TaxID=2830842 RepID=UPI001CC07CA3|nr:PA2817 family protein [Halopseudomonas nanhaiensis]UAW97158.1 dehydrogenase [Halopseudomonas nanhaiensis]
MNPKQPYHAYHLALLKSLFDTLRAQALLMEQVPEESNILFLERFDDLISQLEVGSDDALYQGQDILCQIIARYPQLAHMIPRDLLWYFGGDCLHFMPDEEITLYQALDEQRAETEARGEAFDWAAARLAMQGR